MRHATLAAFVVIVLLLPSVAAETIEDQTANNLDLTTQGTNSYASAFTAKYGDGIATGFGDALRVPKHADLNTASFSWSVWVKFDTTTQTQGIVSKNGAVAVPRLFLNTAEGATVIEFDAAPGEVGNLVYLDVEAKQWYHVVATFNSATQTAKLYVDNELRDTETGIASMGNTVNSDLQIGAVEIDLMLLRGQVDDMAAWNREITASEVSQAYAGLTPSSGLVLHLRMDAADDNQPAYGQTQDASGLGNHALKIRAPRHIPAAKLGGGYHIHDSQAWLRSDAAQLRISGDLSVFVAFCFAENQDIALRQSIVNVKGPTPTATDNQQFALLLREGTHATPSQIIYRHESGAASASVLAGTTQLANGCHRATLTRNVATNAILVKVDGVTEINAAYAVDPDGGATSVLNLGNQGDGTVSLGPNIHELRIWNTLVPQAELDKMADPNDATYTGTLKGDELAAWFFEDRAPVANAGPDQTEVEAGTEVCLASVSSTDPDANALRYTWAQTSGPTAALDDTTATAPCFTPAAGTYVWQVTAHDGALSNTDTVTITAHDCHFQVNALQSWWEGVAPSFAIALVLAAVVMAFMGAWVYQGGRRK